MAKVKKLLQEPANRIKELERLVDRQAQQIERLRKPKVTPIKGRRRSRGKPEIQVICGDSHGAYHDPAAVSAFLGDLELLKPSKIVHVGDIIDCAGFLSSHGVMGVVPELDYTFEQDVLHANELLDRMQKAAPGAKITVIEGNHERRITREIYKFVVRNQKDAAYLLRMFGPEAVLSCEARGVRYIKRDQYYDGLSVSGTVKLPPHGVVQHGEAFAGVTAGRRHMQRLGCSVFFGHNHRLGVDYAEKLDGVIAAFNTGCLCQRRPLYGLTKTTDWAHGYILRASTRSGFLAFPIPIIDGLSYLGAFVNLLDL